VETENYTPVSSHHWETEYTTNKSFHWIDCKDCDATKDSGEHTTDDSGYCTVCDAPVGDTEGLLYDISADGAYAEVIGYEGTATKVIIADTYGDLPVKNIYAEAFYEKDNITSVVIPDSVTSIGYEAFSYCNKLNYNTYGNCKYLGNEDNPYYALIETVNDNYSSYQIHEDAKIIVSMAFDGCARMGSMVIPDGVTSIGDYAFSSCDSLTEIIIPDSVTSIGYVAFGGCTKLTTIYCEAESQPSGWDSYWKGYGSSANVVWGYTGE